MKVYFLEKLFVLEGCFDNTVVIVLVENLWF